MNSFKELLVYFSLHHRYLISCSGRDLRQAIFDRIATLMNLSTNQIRQLVEVCVDPTIASEFRNIIEQMLVTYYEEQTCERAVLKMYRMQATSFDRMKNTEFTNVFRELGLFKGHLLKSALRSFNLGYTAESRSQAIKWFSGISGSEEDFVSNVFKLLVSAKDTEQG